MTAQEYSGILQTLAEDERSVGLKIKAQRWAKNELAAILQLRNGHRVAFDTLRDFNHWYTGQRKASAIPPE
jgi:hypothetical protein